MCKVFQKNDAKLGHFYEFCKKYEELISQHYRAWISIVTISPKGIVRFWSCNKAVVNVFPHKAEPSNMTRTGKYLLD